MPDGLQEPAGKVKTAVALHSLSQRERAREREKAWLSQKTSG
jgi:hypothetical protein